MSKITPVDECRCPEPGWCPYHQVNKPPGWWGLCQRRPEYRRAWAEGRGPGQDPPRNGPGPTPGGPGTEFAKLAGMLGYHQQPGCNCQALATKMDAWGPAECRRRIKCIVRDIDANYRDIKGRQLGGAKRVAVAGLVRLACVLAERRQPPANPAETGESDTPTEAPGPR